MSYDYFAVVDAREMRPTFSLKYLDECIAQAIYSNGVRVTFELVFPDLESRDRFYASERNRREASRCRGRLTILTPHPHITTYPNPVLETEQGKFERIDAATAARTIGVPEVLLLAAQRRAWNLILSMLQAHGPNPK